MMQVKMAKRRASKTRQTRRMMVQGVGDPVTEATGGAEGDDEEYFTTRPHSGRREKSEKRWRRKVK